GRPLLPPRPGAARAEGPHAARAAGSRGARRCHSPARAGPARRLALAHGVALPARVAVPRALSRAAPAAFALRLRGRGRGAHAARAGLGVSRAAGAAARRRAGDRAGGAVRADPGEPPHAGEHPPIRKDRAMDRPLRLIAGSLEDQDQLDRVARTVEALLVVASAPLSL